MNLEDYVITIRFSKNGDAYWYVAKKGEMHMCNNEELRMVSKTLSLIKTKIDSIEKAPIDNKCKHLRTDDNCRWCGLGYMLQCDRCRERKGNDDE